jgi:16S rRNA (guanine527-N7)-methyltransferase
VEPLTPATQERLAAFVERIRADNDRLGLVSPAAMNEFEERLLAPCLVLADLPILQSAAQVVDLGSGNGLPDIPMAIGCPQASVLLVDSQLKRCQFLESVAVELGLDKVRVRHGRVEKIRDEPAPDVFISRFFKDLRTMAAWTRRWRRPGTHYLLFAGEFQEHPLVQYDLHFVARHALGAGKVALEYQSR